jgi:hypothetical protein
MLTVARKSVIFCVDATATRSQSVETLILESDATSPLTKGPYNVVMSSSINLYPHTYTNEMTEDPLPKAPAPKGRLS